MFGVIFGLTDAILGLTILAWGNSIGDLIADTAMAKVVHAVPYPLPDPLLYVVTSDRTRIVNIFLQFSQSRYIQGVL